jgi:hypothetical protein
MHQFLQDAPNASLRSVVELHAANSEAPEELRIRAGSTADCRVEERAQKFF